MKGYLNHLTLTLVLSATKSDQSCIVGSCPRIHLCLCTTKIVPPYIVGRALITHSCMGSLCWFSLACEMYTPPSWHPLTLSLLLLWSLNPPGPFDSFYGSKTPNMRRKECLTIEKMKSKKSEKLMGFYKHQGQIFKAPT